MPDRYVYLESVAHFCVCCASVMLKAVDCVADVIATVQVVAAVQVVGSSL